MKNRASDSWIAISVIACSIVLFIALALGLSGRVLVREGHAVRVRFHDITGIKVSSQVKFAGAPAGSVSGARMLTAAERAVDPDHLVEITLSLFRDVPPLTKNARVSIAADTLLSDKFVQLQDEGAGGPLLADGEILNGVTPTTFDQLARNVDDAIVGLRKTMGGDAGDHAKDLFTKIDRIVESTQSLLTELKPVVKDAGLVVADAKATMVDARATMADARSLIADNKAGISRAVARIDSAAGSMESLAKKGEAFIQDNTKNLSSAISGFRVTSENLKVTSTYSKFLLKDLSERPSRLIWGGGKPPALPSQQEILQSRQPLPDR
ncbi:MAG: MlaD family protein [Verrucomicrobiota bacterium]